MLAFLIFFPLWTLSAVLGVAQRAKTGWLLDILLLLPCLGEVTSRASVGGVILHNCHVTAFVRSANVVASLRREKVKPDSMLDVFS